MTNPAHASVVVCTRFMGIGRTVRMALRGMDVRHVNLAANLEQLREAFLDADPHCVILYVDSDQPDDEGLQLLHFLRRDEASPNHKIPVIVISPRSDIQTVSAAMNGGAHEYALFPTSGETLLRKITSVCTTPRGWIARPDYVGPERKIDRETAEAGEKAAV